MIESRAYTRADPLKGAVCPGFGAIRRKLYVAGVTASRRVNTLYIYDIATNTWTPDQRAARCRILRQHCVQRPALPIWRRCTGNPRTLTNNHPNLQSGH